MLASCRPRAGRRRYQHMSNTLSDTLWPGAGEKEKVCVLSQVVEEQSLIYVCICNRADGRTTPQADTIPLS